VRMQPSPEARALLTERRRWPQFWRRWWAPIAIAMILTASWIDGKMVRYLAKREAAVMSQHERMQPRHQALFR
jgi:hypothetical protein